MCIRDSIGRGMVGYATGGRDGLFIAAADSVEDYLTGKVVSRLSLLGSAYLALAEDAKAIFDSLPTARPVLQMMWFNHGVEISNVRIRSFSNDVIHEHIQYYPIGNS